MLTSSFYIAFSASFWIIPREGTEALLVIILLCSALKESGRDNAIGVVYKNCILALIAGLFLAVLCVFLANIFTGQLRELSEAFASLIAMALLLYVNFETFNKHSLMLKTGLKVIGFLAFISVFRELAETILFYYALFSGPPQQQLGTFLGLFVGIATFVGILWTYRVSVEKWKMLNRLIFNLTPLFMFLLAVMCVGNAINAFQEAGWLGYTPIKNWSFDSAFLHIQSSKQYVTALSFFLLSTGLLFLKQFYRNAVQLIKLFATK